MANYVPDILSRRWVIVAPKRSQRPENVTKDAPKDKVCVFCPGSETVTDPEVFRIGEGEKDTPGWKVRVIPNKFPITDYHEVIIHTPDDTLDIGTMTNQDVSLVFQAYRQRYNFYRKLGHVNIFCNHGEHAGASIKHSHSQLVVLPFQIELDTLAREPVSNEVLQDELFHVYCPQFSQWPYEVWIAPKETNTYFGDITDSQIEKIATITKNLIAHIKTIYDTSGHWLNVDFGYNYYIYPKDNWYLRIIPRFTHRAGFELGTGLSVNLIDPEDAAKELAGVSVHVK